MQTGHVFKLAGRIFGILTYLPETRVFCSVIETDSIYDVCERLGRNFAGRFIPADSDETAWGRTIVNDRPAEVLDSVLITEV
jgi:hypothetical protein